MDTATHFVMGFGLAGLSFVDPVVASNPELAIAAMIGTVAGSQAPDIDTVLRIRKNNASYIRNHRGITHSIPFLFIWTALITAVISLLFRDVPILHVALWTGIAVCVHVFTDVFNTYGTQAMRPFTEKWISWNIIHIFDPVLFTTHVIAILLWFFGITDPAPTFIILYSFLALYYIWRTLVHYSKTKQVRKMDTSSATGDKYYVIPTVHLNRWHVVKAHKDGSYEIGKLDGRLLVWSKHAVSSNHPAVEASKSHPDIQAFLYFTSFAVAEVEELSFGYFVRWGDVRYRHRKQYPFVACMVMDKNYEPISTYVGWLSEDKMEKKLSLGSHM